MQHQLHTEIQIDAPPANVWAVLIDLGKYGDWNPFVVSAEGKPAVGEKLANRMQTPGGRAMTIRPTVTEVDEGRVFEWLGRLGLPGIFDGRHRFELEATENGTRFIQSEAFNGILVRPMRKFVDGKTAQGFEAMNTALKTRAEARSSAV